MVTHILIAQKQLLLVLYHLASCNQEHTPSWMINFNHDRTGSDGTPDALDEAAGVHWHTAAAEERPFSASGQEPLELSREGSNIKIRGHLLDEVSCLSNLFAEKRGRDNLTPKKFFEWHDETFGKILAHLGG